MREVDKRKSTYIKCLFALIWLAIWELAAHFTASALLLPSPFDTAMALITMAGTAEFYLNLLFTALRCSAGIAGSFIMGALAAVLAFRSPYAREFFRLPVSFFKSVPVMAIVIYVILIVKSDIVSIAVCLLMCFPISYSNVLAGLCGMNRDYIELAEVNGLTRIQTYRLVLIPMLRPELSAALNLISGMSWKVVVASEVLSVPKYSVGYEMLKSKYYLETPQLFAYILVLVVLSLIVESALGSFMEAKRSRAKNILRFGGEEEYVDNVDEFVLKNVTKSYSQTGIAPKSGEPLSDAKSKTAVKPEHAEKIPPAAVKVLDNYSVRFERGITAILGPSGRGKTTLARLIAGLEQPDSGEIKNVGSISYLFQEDRLLPWLSTESNMMLGIINERGMSRAVAKERVREIAEKLEIASVLDKMPYELSGGMAHRAALGRALLRRSEVLILDEPFRGIDGELKERLISVLRDEISRCGDKLRTTILITHDEKTAVVLAERIIRL